jgi:hypothetical protein
VASNSVPATMPRASAPPKAYTCSLDQVVCAALPTMVPCTPMPQCRAPLSTVVAAMLDQVV